ncbi:hypothetical protein [Kaarinaea lacus]
MHAGFPCFTQDINQVLRLGAESGQRNGELPQLLDKLSGTVLANGIAVLAKLGFGYLMRNSLLDKQQSEKAQQFFEENFVIRDPNVPGGQRYYQGKFLIRTRKPGDDMNVWLRFCPNPDDLFCDTTFGKALNPLEVISAKAVDEKQADQIAKDPNQVDLVIQFKDIESILGLIGRENVDIVGLLLENLVLLTGNVGHLFKLGAIAKNIELELGLAH